MKLRDPQTGDVFKDIEQAHFYFCLGERCRDCALHNPTPTMGCEDFRKAHPLEASRLMGYEVVEEKEAKMEKENKPSIAWEKIRTVIPFVGSEEMVRSGFGQMMDGMRLSQLIKGELRIIRKPRFTEEEVAVLHALYSAGARWLARGDKHLRWYAQKPYQREEDGKWDMQGDWGTMSGKLPAKLFPSLLPGQSIKLSEITGE